MVGSDTVTCTDPDEYRAGLRRGGIDLILICAGRFTGELTQVKLSHLSLLHGRENLPRIAHLKLSPRRVFITFPTNRESSMKWAGVTLEPGDVVFHSRGEQMYQLTTRACRWASISLSQECLVSYGRALFERDLAPPSAGRILRPSSSSFVRLRRLHQRTCKLVETNPGMIAHPEVDRSLDQDLIHALLTCLATSDVVATTAVHARHAQIMARFEKILAPQPALLMSMPDLCEAIGVGERSLRYCCAEFLGMSPMRFIHLRRMGAVRMALRHAGPGARRVAEAAGRYGFSELGRFAAAYRDLYGERPSDTLRGGADSAGARQFAESA